MNDKAVIAGTLREIIAVNPRTKARLSIKSGSRVPAGYKPQRDILGIQPTVSSIYHASEVVEAVYDEDNRKIGYVNYVQVYNSLNKRCALTIRPEINEPLPKNDLYLDALDFNFVTDGDALCYRLNGKKGTVFSKIAGIADTSPRQASSQNNRVFFNGLKIASLKKDIKYLHEIEMKDLKSMFRRNNKKRFKRNKPFFKS